MKRLLLVAIVINLFFQGVVFAQEQGELDVNGYEQYLEKKKEVGVEYEGKKAELQAQIDTINRESREKIDRIKVIETRIAVKVFMLKGLQIGMKWSSVPFFYIGLVLALLYLVRRRPELFDHYRRLIIVITTILFVLYTTSLFAAENESEHSFKPEIETRLEMVNRLLEASELDKAIIKIERAKKSKVEIGEIDVSSERMIPLSEFRINTLEADYTLGCLYLESGAEAKAVALFLKIVEKDRLRLKHSQISLVENLLWFFDQKNLYKGVYLSILGLSANKKHKGDLLTYVKKLLDAGQAELGEKAIEDILGRMRYTQDYLAAAKFLHGLSKTDQGSELYEKALRAAQGSDAYLSLARYAYDNGMNEDASIAMETAFSRARTSSDYLEYARFALEKEVANADEAYDQAFEKANSCKDLNQFADFALDREDRERAADSLAKGLPKGRDVEDLLALVDLAIRMDLSEVAANGLERTMKVARRFDDFLKLAEYAAKRNDRDTQAKAVNAALEKARKRSEFERLVAHCLEGSQSAMVTTIVERGAKKLRRKGDLQNLRAFLRSMKRDDTLGPLHEAMVKYTYSSKDLYILAELFAKDGRPDDADYALKKIAYLNWSQSFLTRHLKHCLDKKRYPAAVETCRLLIERKKVGTKHFKDPKVLPASKYLPDGETIIFNTLLGTLYQKTGDLAKARDIFERQVAQYIDWFLDHPDDRIGGDLNTYFYLKQAWELAGDTDLLARYGQLYLAIGDFYLDNYRDELQKEVDKLLPVIETLKKKSGALDDQIMTLQRQGAQQDFRIFATICRSLAYLIIVVLMVVIAATAAWRFQKALTRFHLVGFVYRFSEVLGFELCFTVILIPIGLLLMLYAQLLGMLLFIQQETEAGKVEELLKISGGD